MRIARLEIDGFGLFRDARSPELPPGLVLVAGDNEAGKSTLVGFLRAILFGFPRRNAVERSYPPLAGGDEGGRIVVETDAGERWTIQRVRGRRNGLKVAGPDGAERTVEPGTLLFPGVTRELFANIYAFGLDELEKAGGLEGDAARTAIFGAASGGAVGSLQETYRALEKDSQDLFKPGGRTPEINRRIGEVEGVRARLVDARGEIAAYEQRDARRRAIDDELATEQAALRETRAERARVAARRRVWDDWRLLLELERRLETAVPAVDEFPEDGVARLDALEARLSDRRAALDKAGRDLNRARGDVAAHPVDGVLLAEAARIGGLAERRAAYERAVVDGADARREAASVAGALAGLLARLGPEWTIERARGIDRSLFTREAIARFETIIGQTARELERARDQAEDREREHAQAVQEAELAEARVEAAAASPTDERRARARALRAAFRELERVRARREAIEQSDIERASDNNSTALSLYIALAVGALAVTAAVTLVLLSRTLDGVVAALVLAGIAIAVWLAGRSRAGGRGRDRSALDALEAEMGDAARTLERAWAAAALAGEPTEEALETHVRELDQRDAARGEAERRLVDLRNRALAADEAFRLAANERDRSAQAAAEAIAAWNDWLAEQGFPAGLQPATARDALSVLDDCERMAGERDRLATSLEAAGAVTAAFEREAGAVFDAVGRARPAESGIAAAVQALTLDAETARRAAALAEQAERQAAAAEAEVDAAKAAYGGAEAELAELVAAGGAEDAEAFRRRGRLVVERRVLRDQIAGCMTRLSAATGAADRETIGRLFAGDTPEALENEAARLAAEEELLDARCDALLRERAEVAVTLERLASAETVAELRGEEERLLEQIRQKGLEWSRATLARFLLDEAKRRFEAERQPAVLREAARYFRTITDGRYVNILAPLDGGAIEVVEESGARKQASDLSRGAMEQLYLAIRFGYVTTSRDGMERLPLVMDDILVNADARRRREAAAGICEIAARQQVLYFTCHEETIETFRGLTENLSVIRLTSGKIEGS